MSGSREQEYPDDENGDVLRRMASDGIDLVTQRVVDFEHYFPDETSARTFQAIVADTVLEAKLIRPEREQSRGWEVRFKLRLIPTHSDYPD